MYIHNQSIDTFILVHAYWTVADMLTLLRSTKATHVIVQHVPPKLYFLWRADSLKFRLNKTDSATVLSDALNLETLKQTPTIDAYASIIGAPKMAVILDNGEVIGVRDTAKHKGPQRGVSVARDFQADFPEQVHVDMTAVLDVVLAPPSALESKSVQVDLNEPIEVMVSPDSAFQLAPDEENRKTITVTDPDSAESVQFAFIPRTANVTGRIDVWLMQKGMHIGSTTVAADIHSATDTITEKSRPHTIDAVALPATQSDLTLTILEQRSGAGEIGLTMHVDASKLGQGVNVYQAESSLPEDTSLYFQELFADIQGLTGASPAEIDRHLAGKGLVLFDIFPKPLQKLLWERQEQIKAVRIYSQEPWIPWELCRLSFEEDGDHKEGPYFCEAFAVTRWILNQPPIEELSMRKVGLIVPPDSNLAFVEPEKTYVQGLAADQRAVELIDPVPLTVMDAMSTGQYDVWHFTGHGVFRDTEANLSSIYLENNAVLRPENISGRVKNLGKGNPIIFLNGCQVGRGAMTLTGIGGWAHKFIEAKAGAFIGALWNVQDESAFNFAQAFYDKLLAGETVGESARQARLAVRQPGSSTWLAYTVFADSLAKLRS